MLERGGVLQLDIYQQSSNPDSIVTGLTYHVPNPNQS